MGNTFAEWLDVEGHRYVESDTVHDSYNDGWNCGYMFAMRKARNEFMLRAEFLKRECDAKATHRGLVFVSKNDDGSVGILLPRDLVIDAREELSDMAEMYADETRNDWWEADDIARSFAEDMYRLLS